MNIARIAANVGGAGLALWAADSFVYPNFPAIGSRASAGLDIVDFVDAGFALLGAWVGNSAYNKIAG